jgi:ankyrin repeat protein
MNMQCILGMSLFSVVLPTKQANITIIKAMLDNKADPNVKNNDGTTAFHYAFEGNYRNDPETIKLLLDRKAVPTIPDNRGLTAIHHVIGVRHSPTVVKLLLEHQTKVTNSISVQE